MPVIIGAPTIISRAAVTGVQNFNIGNVPNGASIMVIAQNHNPVSVVSAIQSNVSDDAGNVWVPTAPIFLFGFLCEPDGSYNQTSRDDTSDSQFFGLVQNCIGKSPLTISINLGGVTEDIDFIAVVITGLQQDQFTFTGDAELFEFPAAGGVRTLDNLANNTFGGQAVSGVPQKLFSFCIVNPDAGMSATIADAFVLIGTDAANSLVLAETDAVLGNWSSKYNVVAGTGGQMLIGVFGILHDFTPPSSGRGGLLMTGVGL